MISKTTLTKLYLSEKRSVAFIAAQLDCSQNKINYWLAKYNIRKRTISDAIYELKNPNGDPFKFNPPTTAQGMFLYGLGLGLYWGEGAKRGKGGVRLANTDPRLIKAFIAFLDSFFNIKKSELKFGLQIFGDLSANNVLTYWTKELGVKKDQFYKVIVSRVRGKGTYSYKSEYGVLMVYFNNTRLKRLICELITNL